VTRAPRSIVVAASRSEPIKSTPNMSATTRVAALRVTAMPGRMKV
jgi:hypothetical protein